MSTNERPTEPTERRHFYWSGRTLRCDVFTIESDGEEWLDRHEDVLGVDQQRCVIAYGDWGDLIVRLLNENAGSSTSG